MRQKLYSVNGKIYMRDTTNRNRVIAACIIMVMIIFLVGILLINKFAEEEPQQITQASINIPASTYHITYDSHGNIRYENEKYEVRIK
jgi:hypothetical protein